MGATDCAIRRVPAAPLALTPSLALGLLAGAITVQQLPALPGPGVLAAIAVAGIVLLRQRRAPVVPGLLLGFAAAAAAGSASFATRIPPHWEGRELVIAGRVVGLPSPIERGWRFDVEVRGLALGEERLAGQRRLRLSWYVDDPRTIPQSGAWLEGRARLRRPRGTLNPGGFDLEAWALQQRIAAFGYFTAVSHVRPGGPTLDGLRQRLSERIGARVAEPGIAALLRALAVGDQGRIDEAQWRTMRATGVTHLVAISGFHIGAVALLAGALTALLWRIAPGLSLRLPRPRAVAAAGLLAAASYSAIAGLSVPVIRTLAMLAAVALARLLSRAADTPQLLAIALVSALAVDPLTPMSAGFWLSFGGVAWLVWAFEGRRRLGVTRMFVKAQLVASLGLAPLTLLFFQQLSLAGAIANVVAVPLVTLVAVPLLLLSLALGLDATLPGAWLLDAAAALLGAGWPWLERAAALPFAELRLAGPGATALLCAIAGIAVLLAPRGVAPLLLGVALLTPLAWPRHERLPHGGFELVLLDVGQGQAVLLRTRSRSLLFDAGPAPSGRLDLGEAVVVPALRALGVGELDLIVLSHADNDHAGGVTAVQRSYPAAPVLRADAADGAGRCRAGQRWRWDGVEFQLLHPPRHFPYLGNESSCVLRVASPAGSALLPGDLGALIEARLVREQAEALDVDLVLMPHHGSAGSSSPAFVSATTARLALASAGWRNRYGHPAPSVVARWRAAGAGVGVSAETGAIRVRFDGESSQPRVRTEREARRRYWHERGTAVR